MLFTLISFSLLSGVTAVFAGDPTPAPSLNVAASQLGEDMDCTKEYNKSGLKNLDPVKTESDGSGNTDKKSGEGN